MMAKKLSRNRTSTESLRNASRHRFARLPKPIEWGLFQGVVMFAWLWKRLGLTAPLPESRRLPMPFIVGAPRSGTTLLRFMLDAHSDLAIPPETGFLIPCAQLPTQKEALEETLVHSIVMFPPDAPAWEDFQISEADFRAKI